MNKKNLDFDGRHVCVLNTGHKPISNLSSRLKTPEKTIGFNNTFYMPPYQTYVQANNIQPNDSFSSSILYHNSDPHRTGL